MPLIERIPDALLEDEAKHDVLVLGGIHVVAHHVGGGPEGRLETGFAPVPFLAFFFCGSGELYMLTETGDGRRRAEKGEGRRQCT